MVLVYLLVIFLGWEIMSHQLAWEHLTVAPEKLEVAVERSDPVTWTTRKTLMNRRIKSVQPAATDGGVMTWVIFSK